MARAKDPTALAAARRKALIKAGAKLASKAAAKPKAKPAKTKPVPKAAAPVPVLAPAFKVTSPGKFVWPLSRASMRPHPPSAHLPTIKDVKAGRWFRVHDFDRVTGRYAAAAFNDSGRGDARFSPILRSDGTVIPTIYAAAHPRTAIAEILLHEAPMPSTGWNFPWSVEGSRATSKKHLSEVDLPDLRLAALTTFGLQAAGLLVDDLLGGNQPEYVRTRAWSLWLYENMPDIQGLYWMSRRDNEYGCVMLFGDRVPGGISSSSMAHIADYELVVLETLDSMSASVS
ncbi:RES family NAD+ phosphorylase [Roseateles sp. DC23W]|uniref:RES family NAD+ phosphorylase n=1 Tax=Pelomonas dachongensis TaxID=3299029 RepID=A0ABW7EW12_9BURK